MPTLTINEQSITVSEGTSILDAAKQIGIDIPTLCHHADLTPVGSCCMCVVNIKGARLPQPACSTPIQDGMSVSCHSDDIEEQRRTILEMLLMRYHDSGYAESDPHGNELLQLVRRYNVELPKDSKPRYEVDSDDNPFIWMDLNKCILCTRCVRACQEVQGRFVWDVAERGDETRVICGNNSSMMEARCESCGACAAYCPTGALDDRMLMGVGEVDRKVRTTCGLLRSWLSIRAEH